MDKTNLKKILAEHELRKPKTGLIKREIFDSIKKKSGFITIISGIRRCGKSTLLDQLRQEISGYYVNFDDERLIDFSVKDFELMLELLIELFGERQVFFFDEIQNIWGWERFVRRLHDSGKQIFVTGSNASMLSKELGTHLTGRNIKYSLYPFSFWEFFSFKGYEMPEILTSKDESLIKRHLNNYIEKGGFPEYLRSDEIEYLKNLYENIIYRDIITRYGLTNEKALKETSQYAASNIGKELSFNKLRLMTGLSSATTIKEYFEYLENSYLAFLIPKYDFSLRKQVYYNKKAYFIDTGMTKLLGFRTSKDRGRILENTVFLELKRKGNEIYFHKGKNECDFLIRKGTRIVDAIQVTEDPSAEREIEGIKEAMEVYKLKKGLILTDDEEREIRYGRKRIIIRPVWKWLLGL